MTGSSTTGSHQPASATAIVPTVLVGVAAGFLSGLFGVGGGILIVPALVLALGMDQRLAHGTSLAAVLPISMAGLVTYTVQGNVEWDVALFLAIGAVAGAVLGTHLLHVLPQRVLAYAFAALLVASAVRLFVPTDPSGSVALGVVGAVALVVIGVASGIVAGLLGVGGGIVMVPALVVLFGLSAVVAKGTSLAVIVPTAIMGTWRNRKKRNADLRVAAIVGVAGIVSAVAGGWLSNQLSETAANVSFACLLVVVAVRMLWGLRRDRAEATPAR